MIEETIAKIETRIQNAAVSDERKRELLHLLGTLKSQIADLSKTHEEKAQQIAGLTDLSTQVATRPGQNPEVLKQALERLSSSVEDFESSHPKLVQIVNGICTALSNVGI